MTEKNNNKRYKWEFSKWKIEYKIFYFLFSVLWLASWILYIKKDILLWGLVGIIFLVSLLIIFTLASLKKLDIYKDRKHESL